MNIFKQTIKGILGGMFIGAGALAYLSIDSKVVGALFFTLGLFAILTLDLNLFTGKLCYVVEKKNYKEVGLTLLGNFIGTFLTASLVKLTRLNVIEKAQQIVDIKLNDNLLSLFILAIFCNILIYLAVEGYKNFDGIWKVLALFFGVSVFVICGFEHSVADMFYFCLSTNLLSGQMILRLFIIILGNIVGGLGIRLLLNYLRKEKENEKI